MNLQPLSDTPLKATVCCLIALGYSFFSTIVFVIRKDLAPIPKRLPLFTVIFVIGMQLFIFSGAIFTVNVLCAGWMYLGEIATMLCFASYILRLRYIIQKYSLMKEAADETKVDDEDEIIKIRDLAKKTRLQSMFIILFVLLIIHIAFSVVGQELDPVIVSGCKSQNKLTIAIAADIIPSVGYIIAIIYYLWGIRAVKDSFGIATEMKIVAATMIICMIFYLGLEAIFNLDLTDFILPLMSIITQTAVVTWPTIETFRSKYSKLINEEDDLSPSFTDDKLSNAKKEFTNINNVLQNQIGVRYFTEYLISELSVENIIFLKAVEHFRVDPNLKSAQKIYNDFIVDGAPTELNINFKTKGAIKDKIISGVITSDLYDNVKTVIVRQLEDDAWVRFTRSDTFKKAVLEYSTSQEWKNETA